jgi:hypothetical protein
MSDVFKKKERYDYLIDQLTDLEIKYSDVLETNQDAPDSTAEVLLADIKSIKNELEELDGIHQEYQQLLNEKEIELRKQEESKEYLEGFDKAKEEINKEIEYLQDLLRKHLSIVKKYETVLQTKDENCINKDLTSHIKMINNLKEYEIDINKDIEFSKDEVSNWENLQYLYDTKEMITSSINRLIEQKVELQRIKDDYIKEKVNK